MRFMDRKGSVAVITALTMPMAVASVGFGIEAGYDHFLQSRLQQAADAAAFAGGVELRRGSSLDVVTAAADAAARQSGLNPATDTVKVASTGPNAIETTVSRTQPRLFSAVFNSASVTISARSVSAFGAAASACIVALDPSASGAASFSGQSNTTLNSCSVMANSISASAIDVQGSALVTTPCLYSVGGVAAVSGTHLTCEAAQTGVAPIGDPYASLALPSETGPCLTTTGASLAPGRYCNGVTLHGTVNLAPGVYIFSSGTLKTAANTVVTGSGVTLVFVDNASLELGRDSDFQLSAPTTGTYAGMLMVGGAHNAGGVSIDGDPASTMTGAIYFPAQAVSYRGDFAGANGCTQIVAKTVAWSGSASLSVNCSAFGMQPVAVGGVSLVG